MGAAEKIHIVGIGDDGLDGLTDAARKIVESTTVLIGSKQTLAAVPSPSAERLESAGDLEAIVQWIDDRKDKSITVLTSGDPLFYGIARYLCDHLGKDRFEVVPHVSSMQLAFARVKESWDEAYLADLSRVDLHRAVDRIRSAERTGFSLTSKSRPQMSLEPWSREELIIFRRTSARTLAHRTNASHKAACESSPTKNLVRST